MTRTTRVLLDGLAFGEGPRWHEGRLWFSDMHAHKVLALGLDGKVETIVACVDRRAKERPVDASISSNILPAAKPCGRGGALIGS